MKFIALAIVVTLGGAAAPAGAQDTAAKIEAFNEAVQDPTAMFRSHCRREWPADFQMQKYCIEQQTEGYRELAELFTRAQEIPDLGIAFMQCAADWTDLDGDAPDVDFQMVAYCSQQQAEAYDALNR